ncbi:putative LRR receptor-like serine/threonine-protein kinase PAM74 [Platanthera zijinensis]|uniref:LRR receptor-like serine/threonine-protein kinase PAM74 n=1 Tax=Platanthera zijinensis TaxID=2320716 RepID=A0AAP0BCM9_9ASPA
MSSCPLLLFAFIFSLFSSTQSQNPRIRGLLLNCGAAAPTDALGGLLWLPDFAFISTGESRSISFPGLLPTLSTLRSFPGAGHPRRKFCYIIPTFRGSRYLVRTTYFYGGINGPGDPPVFDQIVDGTFWTVVNTTADYVARSASSYEGVFLARGTKMRVCLAGNDYTDSNPFMNTLEMIVLEDSVYNSTDFRKKALGLIMRSRFGYDGPIVRYPDDRYDRYWQPFVGNGPVIRSPQIVSVSGLWDLPPANVFNTALTSDGDNSMELQWPPISLPTSSYYVALYFADMSKGNSRTFDVFINGYIFYHNLEVTSSGLVVFSNNWNLSGITRITLQSEFGPPPIICAGEVFGIMTFKGITATRDVIALESLKKSINKVPLNWDGDPCLPHEYAWFGITCSNGSQIRVVSLNLSNMGLSGLLPPSIANLTALTDISFAHNNLSGHVPNLGRLRRLERLHLQDNHFDGNIPPSLGNLTSLRELFLQNNNLTGPIPSALLNKPGLNLGLLDLVLGSYLGITSHLLPRWDNKCLQYHCSRTFLADE